MSQEYKGRKYYRTDMFLAGFFDGEGCIMIQRYIHPPPRRPSYALVLRVGSTTPHILGLFQHMYGGTRIEDRTGKRKRPYITWELRNKGAARLLRRWLPYLIVHKRQALLGLEFQVWKDEYAPHYGKLSSHVLAKLAHFKDSMNELNRNGWRQPMLIGGEESPVGIPIRKKRKMPILMAS